MPQDSGAFLSPPMLLTELAPFPATDNFRRLAAISQSIELLSGF
jgi:hypothetical protein